jgi:glutathione S-transferase
VSPPSSPIPHPIRLYGFDLSGHVHRVRLMLSMLRRPFDPVPVGLANGEQKRREFLARNVFGQVPVIEDGDAMIADSNAILVYLALTYDARRQWLPVAPLAQAEVQRWLSAAAGPLAYGPAAARASVLFKRPDQPTARDIAVELFKTMDRHLASRAWLAASPPTIADVAMYSDASHAPEGGVPLEPFRHLCAWTARVEALPGFVGLTRSPLPAAA